MGAKNAAIVSPSPTGSGLLFGGHIGGEEELFGWWSWLGTHWYPCEGVNIYLSADCFFLKKKIDRN